MFCRAFGTITPWDDLGERINVPGVGVCWRTLFFLLDNFYDRSRISNLVAIDVDRLASLSSSDGGGLAIEPTIYNQR